jgi:hypothetical protein
MSSILPPNGVVDNTLPVCNIYDVRDPSFYHLDLTMGGMGDYIRGYTTVLARWRKDNKPIIIYHSTENRRQLFVDIYHLFKERPQIIYYHGRNNAPRDSYQEVIVGKTQVCSAAGLDVEIRRPFNTIRKWVAGEHIAVYPYNYRANFPRSHMKALIKDECDQFLARCNDNHKRVGLPLTFQQSLNILLNCKYVVGIEGGWTHVAELFNIPYYIITNPIGGRITIPATVSEQLASRVASPADHHRRIYMYYDNLTLVSFQEALDLL